MTRYAIDAPALRHIVTEQLAINPEHQLRRAPRDPLAGTHAPARAGAER